MADSLYRDATERALAYARQHRRTIQGQVGSGWDGIILSTDIKAAIKALRHEPLYSRERDVYRRLSEHRITQLAGFRIPRLIGFDDTLWVVEMELVSPPFIVDFAGARVDSEIDFPEEITAEWVSQKQEVFGDNWPAVRKWIFAFRQHGIYLGDINPNNIKFAGDEPPARRRSSG
ncbi:MAG: hypothetical protein WED34_13740 [Planctomycetales bacterium]